MSEKLKLWNIYYTQIPYWDDTLKGFVSKVRPVLIYNFSGGDVIAFELTSNQNEDGSRKREAMDREVAIKTSRHGLIKATKPLTINQNVFLKKDGKPVSDKIKRQVKAIFKKFVVLPETKEKLK